MIIHGREVGFRRTVSATINLAKLCPDGKLENISGLFQKEDAAGEIEQIAKIIVVLNKADEDAKCFDDPAYRKNPLTLEEVLALDMDEFKEVQAEAIAAFVKDGKTTVGLKDAKKNEPENHPAE